MSWPRIVSGHHDLAVAGKSQVPDYHPRRTPYPTPYPLVVDVLFGKASGSYIENHRSKTLERLALRFLKQLLQSTVYSQGKADFHMARQLKSMSHHNTIIAQSASDRASRMPPWQSSDNFQVSEHHPILRVELTLHNTIAGLRKAVRPAFCETSKWVHGVRTADRC
jgi:hypothetical protein